MTSTNDGGRAAPNTAELDRIVEVLLHEVVPLTTEGVAVGNKVFGAAVIERASLEVVVAATNAETENPLFHGEIAALNRFWALSVGSRPEPGRCLFVSTHEPCSLCLSAITWSGFANFSYLFTYQDSRDAFAIPHDLRILDEVFGVADGAYRRSNAFWEAHSLRDLAAGPTGSAEARAGIAELDTRYAELSATYQAGKGGAAIPLD